MAGPKHKFPNFYDGIAIDKRLVENKNKLNEIISHK